MNNGYSDYVEYNGMSKTRLDWCSYLDTTYGSLMGNSNRHGGIHNALKMAHEARDRYS